METWKVTDEILCAKVNVADSPTFYGWVFPFEGENRFVGSEEILDKHRAMVKASNKMFIEKG